MSHLRAHVIAVGAVFLAGLLSTSSAGAVAGTAGGWTKLATMPVSGYGVGAATGGDGRVYVMGGSDENGDIQNVNEAYDPATNTWAGRTAMPAGRMRPHLLTTSDGRIWVVGGGDVEHDTPVDTVDVYNPSTNTWAAPAPTSIPTHRGFPAVALGGDGLIYVIGGCCTSTPPSGQVFDIVEAYNPATNTWSTRAPMPTPTFQSLAVTGADGRIYVMGGATNAGGGFRGVQIYDPTTNTWTTGTSAPLNLDFESPATLGPNGLIYVLGGFAPDTSPSSAVHTYDPATDSWGQVQTCPTMTARYDFAAATGADGRIYAMGGSNFFLNQGGNVATPEAFDSTSSAHISAVTPGRLAQGAQLPATITGAGFAPGASLFICPGGVSVSGTSILSSTRLTATLKAAATAATGPRNVGVLNPDGTGFTCLGCLVVDGPPTVTSLSPHVGAPGKTETVNINGKGFQPGAKPSFGPGIVVNTTSFVNSTRLTVQIHVAPSAPSGVRSVSLANPDGGVATCKLCFLVSDPSLPGRIVFQSNRTGKYQIYVMRADGTSIKRITHDAANDQGAAWSPDGSKIAFVSDRTGNQELYVMNANGTGVTQISHGPGQWGQPTWSPDATMLADENNRSGHFQIYTMQANGSGLTRITNDSHEYGAVSWSPTGARIVFDTNRPGNYEIYTIRPNGLGLMRLTNNPARDGDPEWSPDGTHIVFDSNRDGNGEIYSMSAGGSSQTRLTINPAADVDPTWSGDSKWIAFESDRSGNAEIFTMKANGSSQIERTYTANAVNDGASWTG